MPKAANFKAPKLMTNGCLARAQALYRWTDAETDLARVWYEHFLELRWEDPKPLYVMDRNADLLWHVHYREFWADYQAYCNQVIGTVLPHVETVPPHTPTPAQTADADKRYKKHPSWGPLPYSSTGCH